MNIFPHIIKYFKYSIPMTTKYSFMCPGLTTSSLWVFISSAGRTVLKSLLKFLVTSVRKIPRSRGQDYFEAPHTCCQVAFQKHILISPFSSFSKEPCDSASTAHFGWGRGSRPSKGSRQS